MTQRLTFVQAVLHRAPGQSIRALCAECGITEKTGHKWLARFAAGGPAALADRSHRPHVPAHALPPAIVAAVVALRARHPTWGARKLRAVLTHRAPAVAWPAASTITALLTRHGLIAPRRRRPAALTAGAAWAQGALTPAHAPNDVWTADFKGEFRLARGPYCFPLTISDLASRYVLALEALPSTAGVGAQGPFHRAFARYGLPRVIRTDNGVPFGAPCSLGGLSALAVWWIRLGIRPERIAKGKPQQNGAHERMHKTLKAEATRPPEPTLARQQGRFDRWRRTFNDERPHESLANARPAERYTPSLRPLPRRLPPLPYPAHCELRRVAANGHVKWRGTRLFLSSVLAGQEVAFTERADDEWTLAFGPLTLGTYSASLLAFTEHLAWPPTDS
jgi:transposase InsO family protein